MMRNHDSDRKANLSRSERIPSLTSMLVVTTILAFLSHTSWAFILPSPSRKRIVTSSKSLLLQNTERTIYTTKLFAQKKKPRFSQKGSHISQENSSTKSRGGFKRNTKNKTNSYNSSRPKRRQPTSQQKQPWASGKSIDDLESTMSKRWGTLDDYSASMEGEIPEGFELFDEDEQDFEIIDDDYANGVNGDNFSNLSSPKKVKQKTKNKGGSDRWRRPVLDPWDEDESKPVSKFSGKREYYDQDDEGFEIEEVDKYLESDDSYVPRVDHLIAPKSAGGGGVASEKLDNTSGGGYFFNPNAAVKKTKDPPLSKKKRPKGLAQTNASLVESVPNAESKNHRTRSPPSKPLLDEATGKPRLLTVDEALNRFQESIDEGMMEVIETAEVPILAKKANAQSWDDLGVTSTVLLENLQYDMNCPNPLAVQEKSTPAILTGNDLLVGTYTGSGKTLAFLVPLVQRLLWNVIDEDEGRHDPGLAVLIVAPGRELASQIVSVARDLLQDTGLTVQLAIGGTTFKRSLEQLRKRKPNIVVGTPGRIAELIVGKPGEKSGRLKVGALQSLVLDEFDALLEYKAHRDPTQAIMKSLKRRHGNSLQSILCSATATDIMNTSKVLDFLRPGFETAMADEEDVLVTCARNNDGNSESPIGAQVSRTVIHGVVNVPHKRMALDAVRKILHTEPIPQQILIFVENARKVDIVVEKLADRGIIAAPLHGGMGSEKMDRAEVSRALREGYVGIVVATELAARGLDAPLLTHVINLDLPTDASHYAHRSGRCGRGGRPGVVINITTSPKERKVPKRFADTLGVEMFTAETKGGKLILVDPATQVLK